MKEIMTNITFTSTYDPADNKLRLRASERLSPELYARVKAAGFAWAPKQEIFVAGMWTPSREDLLIELCGEIGDEDTTLVERAQERAERFTDYQEKRASEAVSTAEYAKGLNEGKEFGQPILIGHHSQRRAEKEAEKVENALKKTVSLWETSQYWEDRAKGALCHAKYKELPTVRARRIKTIESDKRKQEKYKKESEKYLPAWQKEGISKAWAMSVANYDRVSKCFPLDKYPRTKEGASTYEGSMSLYSALDDEIVSPEEAAEIAIRVHQRSVTHYNRWIQHYENRLAYERAMMDESGGLVTDKVKPEVGGAVRCLWSPREGWAFIKKVNKVTLTILHTWGHGQPFNQNVKLDKIYEVMSKSQVDAARESGQLYSESSIGFYLLGKTPETPQPKDEGIGLTPIIDIDSIRDTLKSGIKAVSADQLFPTPEHICERMVEMADIFCSSRILEPSAGTGNIIKAVQSLYGRSIHISAVEINYDLAKALESRIESRDITHGDFLDVAPSDYAEKFDAVIMNPPFKDGLDIKHVLHALDFLDEGGVLVGICANGPRQQAKLEPLAEFWEPLPNDTFMGTNVNAALFVIRK